ncbi:ABC-2 type transport system permease protein [Evansella caseinilytica]|uniref:ABC-2 type transport system permease protein n=1 Tax=Evansella caseinilytica TaxID=1503961 RepID=A0A1H3UTM6_9BACI|nr:ABC transporter permease subunit [Evansella caseinilytica]SDZ65783.1 ABC-2 type transport system permease protein [Evansella caseinilytica]
MIFKRELKKNSKSLIIWLIILSALTILLLSVYPQFAQDREAVEQLLSAYPETFMEALGMDRLDIGSVIGFYGLQVYLYITLFGGIYVAMLASNIVAKEENEKTIEFLLSKPVTRSQIIGGKLLAVITNIMIFNLILGVVSIIGFQFTDEAIPWSTFSVLIFGAILLHVSFAAISFLLSAAMRKTRTITSLSLGIVLFSYFINVISAIAEDLSSLKYLSFYYYIDAAAIIDEGAIPIIYIVIMLCVTAGCIGLSYVTYNKKNIAV